MQNRSDTWKALAATGSFRLETVAEIGGVQYPSISAPIINRALLPDALSVGNCVSASLQLSMLTQRVIPKSAEIVIQKRLTDDTVYSEWLPAGTFYISKRKSDPVTGLLTFECYDSMLKANTPYPITEESEAEFPKPMTDCIQEIADRMGVEVDSRTWAYIETGIHYVVPLPIGLSMMRVLGYIGGVHGGNWIITPENRLRFVPLLSSVGAESAPEDSRVDVRGIIGKINLGDPLTVSRVSIGNGTDTFSLGDDSGFTLTIPTNPYATQYIAEDLLEKLGGLVYNPYTLEKAIYDPAAELGDYVISKTDIRSILYSENVTYNLAFRGDISSPFKAEMEDEYPYSGTSARVDDLEGELRELITIIADKASIEDLSAVYAMIQNLSVEDIKTGIIHSDDYEIRTIPRVYPAKTLYPSDTTFPSNGETVLKGFAIDFAAGVIYGAFYSDQIAALQESMAEWEERIASVMEVMEAWDERLETIAQHETEQDTEIERISGKVDTYDATIEKLGKDMTSIQETISDIKLTLQNMKNALVYPKSPVKANAAPDTSEPKKEE